ncbi:putative aminotransferase-like, plant mobile domain-containing protein [Rosa chinensis]|uniref:Putative aminotransferase-like, plant mobile domain-containing protein n=1 Tax=Rosa chinensis TaxID=74649 RepID=A0A2P6SCJ5_ROSCH|nr:putative aminotransferase-like, plant mobile domain-containing protein [Rosa chinensis]
MADDASELEAGSEGSDILTKNSAEFATKFKKAFDASKDTLQNSVVCQLAKNKEPLGMCTLGPHYYAGMPLVMKEVLEGSLVDTSCLAYGASWSTWSSEFKLPRVWPKLTPKWSKWVPRMEHFFAQKWKDYGIYDSIKMTEQEIHMDRPLLEPSLCFWSSATNTINLPLGPMTPTLLDMAAIFGFRPNGEAVCATAKFPSSFHASLKPKAIKNDKKAKDDAEAKAKQLLNYSTFYATHAVDEAVSETRRQPPKQHEHAAFLLYWLCKFVFSLSQISALLNLLVLQKLLAWVGL